eukprot:gene61215-81602_t
MSLNKWQFPVLHPKLIVVLDSGSGQRFWTAVPDSGGGGGLMQARELALQYDLIGRLYDAALHEDHWPGLCADLAIAFGANNAAALLQPAGGAVLAGADEGWLSTFLPHLERA